MVGVDSSSVQQPATTQTTCTAKMYKNTATRLSSVQQWFRYNIHRLMSAELH